MGGGFEKRFSWGYGGQFVICGQGGLQAVAERGFG